jgi:hypothetical protein
MDTLVGAAGAVAVAKLTQYLHKHKAH